MKQNAAADHCLEPNSRRSELSSRSSSRSICRTICRFRCGCSGRPSMSLTRAIPDGDPPPPAVAPAASHGRAARRDDRPSGPAPKPHRRSGGADPRGFFFGDLFVENTGARECRRFFNEDGREVHFGTPLALTCRKSLDFGAVPSIAWCRTQRR